MRKTVFILIIAVLFVLAGYAIVRADEAEDLTKQFDNLNMSLNMAGAKLQLIDEQIQGLMEKRQELNRQIGISVRNRALIDEQIKALEKPNE